MPDAQPNDGPEAEAENDGFEPDMEQQRIRVVGIFIFTYIDRNSEAAYSCLVRPTPLRRLSSFTKIIHWGMLYGI